MKKNDISKEEKEYYLKIIHIQDQMLGYLQSKNFTGVSRASYELEKFKKSPFEDSLIEMRTKKEELNKRFKNLLTEIESVVKELNSL